MPYVIKQLNILRDVFKDKAGIKAVIAMGLFLAANILKIVLFNYCLIPKQNIWVFEYKLQLTIFLFIIIYPVIFAVRKRMIFLTIYILQTLYILVNISYYLYFHSYLHILQWFMLFSEGFSAANHFAAPKSVQMLIAFIDLPVFIYVFLNYFNISKVRVKLRFYRMIIIAIALISLVVIEFQNYSHSNSLVNFVNSRFDGESKIVERYGTMVNNIVGVYLNRSDKALTDRLHYGKDISGGKEASTEEIKDKPNFVIIQVESMDANVVNQKYKGSYIAPYLHSLSGKNVYYPYLMSYHMGGGTSDSEFSIINSVEPIDGYPAIKIANYNYPNSFVKTLLNNSYDTVAFHGNVGGFFNRDVAFPRMGFQEFFDMTKMNMKNVGWGAPDADVFNYAFNELSTRNQPFFSYIITMTSHGPFTNANNYYKNDRYSDIRNETVRNYFNSISYVDQSINDFVTKIKENFKNTYIFIWGDHTPGINNADEYKTASFTLDGRYFEFVPLIIITPDNKVYREEEKLASFMDISPTILNLSKTSYDIKSNGRDLLKFGEDGGGIPFKGGIFDRESLFDQINTKAGNAFPKK